jgi:hypothetical protein
MVLATVVIAKPHPPNKGSIGLKPNRPLDHNVSSIIVCVQFPCIGSQNCKIFPPYFNIMNALGAKFSAFGLIFARIFEVCNKLIYTHLLIFMVKTALVRPTSRIKYPAKVAIIQQSLLLLCAVRNSLLKPSL